MRPFTDCPRDAFLAHDLEATAAAIVLNVHAIGCDDIPAPQRSQIAGDVECWLESLRVTEAA